ncbi:pentapeptide repeat protein [Chondrocystis sp. NIES-4102]|nr:pentapeptide repeat protein [Chondrocystis sp. NIES-4102]
MVGKNLTKVKFEKKFFGAINLNLSKTILSELDLSEFNFGTAILREANLDNCDLYLADLSRVNFQNASLKNADLRKANLYQSDLSGANLTDANLSYCNLRNANLSNANLSNTKLVSANLSMACLRKANLNNADLTKANLRSDTPEKQYSHNNHQYNFIDLKDANLSGAILKGTLYDEHTRFPIKFNPQQAGAYLISPGAFLE